MVIKNNIIPFGDYTTINIFGILFTKKDLTEKVINHENIHTALILEMSIITFLLILFLSIIFNISLWWLLLSIPSYYVIYLLEYIIIRLKHSKLNCAYHDISFEEEAYNNEYNLDYLKSRKPFNWIKYLQINHFKSNC